MEQLYEANALDNIKEEINKGELAKYSKIIDLLIEEGYTSFDIAAALLKFYIGDNKAEKHQELDMVDSYQNKSKSNKIKRLYINIGKRKGASARHILAAILQESGVPKEYIGNIDIYDKFTFVEVQEDYADAVIDNLNNKRIKRTKVTVEIANPRKIVRLINLTISLGLS